MVPATSHADRILMRWPLASSRQVLNSGFFPWQSIWLQPGAASSFVTEGGFSPACPLVLMSTRNRRRPWRQLAITFTYEAEFRAHGLPAKKDQMLSPIWRVPGRNEVCRESEVKRAQGRACVDHLKPRELYGTLPSYLQAGKGTSGTGYKMKTDCWWIASLSTSLPPLHPQTSIVAQFPCLLRRESPSCHNSSANLHILYAEFLPAGNVSGAYKSCWQCTRRQLDWVGSPLFSLQSCSPLSRLAVRDCTFRTFFPFYFSSASHDYLPFVHSHPHPTPTPSSTPNLGNGWRFPGQDLGELQSHPASLEMQPLLGVVFLLDGAPGQCLRCPSASVSPAYQRYRTGVSLALRFQVLSLDIVHRAQEAVLFYDQGIFHLIWFIHSPSPTVYSLLLHSASGSLKSMGNSPSQV